MTFRTQAQKALEEARNAKVIGKSLEAHLTVYASEEIKMLVSALDSDIAQLLIVSELTITDEAAPSDAISFDDVAFSVAHASGEVCDRCRRVDETVKARSYKATICDHCAEIVEANFAEALQEGFE